MLKKERGHKRTTVFFVMQFGESSGQDVYDVVNYCQHGYTLENKQLQVLELQKLIQDI